MIVWVVTETDEYGDESLALIADSLDAAKRGVADYVREPNEQPPALVWKPLHGMFDTQEVWQAGHAGNEYHVHEEDVVS